MSTLDKEGLTVLDLTMKDRPSHIVFKNSGKSHACSRCCHAFKAVSEFFFFFLRYYRKSAELSVKCQRLSVVSCSSYFLQTQPKCSHGETILISALAMVIRRADSPLSLWTCLPEMEFTSSRCDSDTPLLCQLFRGFSQHWSSLSLKKKSPCVTHLMASHL